MAKPTKGGLGRGLDSLLGATIEEAIIDESNPVEEQSKNHPEGVTSQEKRNKPVPAKTPISKKDSEAIEAESAQNEASRLVGKIEAVKNAQEKERRQIRSGNPYIEEDDHVVIKEVKERQADEVLLTSVYPNPDQPRTNFKQEEIEELAASIEKEGLLQPVLVRSVGKRYQIIAGERRWQACKSIGMKTIPVRVREADDDKVLELALIENIQRADLNPIEEAYGYRRLMERRNLTQSEVALAVSKGRSTIANALRLLELPEDAQQLLFEEKISAGHARAILSIPTKEGRQKLTERMVKEKISVREAEAIARLLASAKTSSDSKRQPTPPSFKSVARSLRERLETNVRVKTVQGKNKIEIEFKDEDELKRLFAIISSEVAKEKI